MEFQILGVLEVRDQGELLPVGTPRTRSVLGVLLTHPGEVVSVDRLVDELWPKQPPRAARTQVHDYVSRLRRALRAGPTGQAAADRLVTRKPGYLLELRDQELDRHRFERLLAEARGAYHDAQLDRCLQLYREAHRLWRGEPFADVPLTPSIGAAITSLTELHLTSLEERYETALAVETSPNQDLVADLTALVAANPLRERPVTQLMRALHRAGRTAEALKAGRDAKQRLADELGIDPGPQLPQTERAILRGELDTATSTTGSSARITARPAQLPPDVSAFTGRHAQLADLDALLSSSDDQPTAVVISALSGTAGVGKTALAVHWAHRIADRFLDGQLFLDLHGFTEGVPPVEPADALDRLLRALGVPAERIPTDVDDRAGLWRSVLAGRRMLIVLDNAATEAQVAPLLPGSPGCPVVVTSRRRLAGLDAAHPMPLDVLPVAEAVALFARSAGERRLATDAPDAVADTVELCGRLPLAIRIAAARLRSHPTWRVSHLVERLRDRQHRLGELVAGQRSVAAALDLSYQHLSSDQQETYRLLGLHPGPEFDAHAAAALLGSTLVHARRMLDQLLEVHLLHEFAPGRYRFHDLIRTHAAHVATGERTAPSSDAALGRLLDYYRHTASAAVDTAYPYEREDRPPVPPAHTPTPELIDPAAAVAWLDTDLPNLLPAARSAPEHGRPAHLLHLSTILHRHLRIRGRYHDAETLHHQALLTACATGNQAAELEALVGLGWAHRLQGRYGQAADHFGQALRIARTTGSRTGELNALIGIGGVHWLQGRSAQAIASYQQALQLAHAAGHRLGELNALIGLGRIRYLQGRYAQATEHLRQALQIARISGDRTGELNALTGLGHLDRMQGRYEQAADHLRQALQIARATGNRTGELNALTGFGAINRMRGRYEQAADHLGQALQIAHATGNRTGEMNALVGLGQAARLLARHEQAIDYYQQLLDLAGESGDRNFEFEARQGLGRLHCATGDPATAITHHDHALTLASELGQRDDQARAHDGLAHAYHALDRHEQARGHWRHALDILTDLGVDYTDEAETTVETIRAHLAAVTER